MGVSGEGRRMGFSSRACPHSKKPLYRTLPVSLGLGEDLMYAIAHMGIYSKVRVASQQVRIEQ